MKLTTKQSTYSAAMMFGMNLVFIAAVLFVFINGTHPSGFVASAQEMWKSQESMSVIEFSFSLMAINLLMLFLALISKDWVGIKQYLPAVLSWVAVIFAFMSISVDLVFTYLWAAIALSIRAYSQRKSVIRA